MCYRAGKIGCKRPGLYWMGGALSGSEREGNLVVRGQLPRDVPLPYTAPPSVPRTPRMRGEGANVEWQKKLDRDSKTVPWKRLSTVPLPLLIVQNVLWIDGGRGGGDAHAPEKAIGRDVHRIMALLLEGGGERPSASPRAIHPSGRRSQSAARLAARSGEKSWGGGMRRF